MAELSKEKALEQIHELQQIAMDMLLDISAACRKAGLRFYMAEGSLIVCEMPAKEEIPEQAGGLTLFRRYKYGKTELAVYR